MKASSHSVFATPKIRAVRRSIIKFSPKARYSSAFWSGFSLKIMFVEAELQIISCEATSQQRFPPKISCRRQLKKFISQNCYLLSVICNAKKSFLETVILLYCNAWCELALSKKTGTVLVFQESETYFSFSKTVIL